MSKYKHECYDWDGMEIDYDWPEFESCNCFDEVDEDLKEAKELYKNGLIEWRDVTDSLESHIDCL